MTGQDSSNNGIDQTLRGAAERLQHDVAGIDVAPFQPNSRRAPMVAAVLLVVVTLGGVAAFVRGSDDTVQTPVATEVRATVTTAPPTSPPPDTTADTEPVATTEPSAETSSPGTTPAIPPVAVPDPRPAPAEPVPLADMVTTIDVRVPDLLEQPAAGETVIDPAFGRPITRFTDSAVDEYILPVQSPASAWNADETMLLLYATGLESRGRHQIYDVTTRQLIAEPDISPSDIEHVFWSPVERTIFFYAEGISLMQFDVSTGAATALATFDQCDSILAGVGAVPSADGNTFGLFCAAAEGDQVISYSRATDTAVSQPASGSKAPIVSSSGTTLRERIEGGAEGLDQVLDAALEPTGIVIDPLEGTTTDNTGRDIAVGASFDGDLIGTLVTVDVMTGASQVVVGPDTGYPFPPSGTSVAALNGVVAVATSGPADLDGWDVLDGEVLLVDLRGAEPAVFRVAHNRTSNQIDYWSGTFVSVSPSGSRIAFSSDWGSARSVDTYIVDLAAK